MPVPTHCHPCPAHRAVLDARLSRMGVPLVTLSTSRAYVWSADLQGWACVADESFAASQYMPMLSLAGQGAQAIWLGGAKCRAAAGLAASRRGLVGSSACSRPTPQPLPARVSPAGEISGLQAEVLRGAIPRAALPGLQVRPVGGGAADGVARAP